MYEPYKISKAIDVISDLGSQALVLYYRCKALIDFVNKNGGLGGANTQTINAYNALLQVANLIDNQSVIEGDYLATLTQNLKEPQI